MEIRFANPIHPGEMLREEFMVPLSLSAGKLAKAIGVPRSRIERLAREETALSVDTAVRLGRYFKTSAQLWLNMQTSYELDCLHADKKRLAALDQIKPLERPDLEDEAA
ncbi:MAG: addiction module antidote protein, HigA family [Robiginitomaculum sp.]|nr:MAG: addiction module antidote protein, HigA family [Robiginitomaculum sp.]